MKDRRDAIVKAAYQALSLEQEHLGKVGKGKDSNGDWIVRKYDEKWIQYLLLKQFLTDSLYSRVEAETTAWGKNNSTEPTEKSYRVDLVLFEKDGDRAQIIIEIKGPSTLNAPIARANLVRLIQHDLEKLEQVPKISTARKYVLGLGYGKNHDDVEAWLKYSRDSSSFATYPKLVDMGDEFLGIVCAGS